MANFNLHYDVAEDGGNGYQKTAINNDVYLYPSQIVESNVPKDTSEDMAKINSKDNDALKQFFESDDFQSKMNVTVYSSGLVEHDTGETFLVGENATSTFNTIEAYDVATYTQKVGSDISFVSLLTLVAYCGARDYWKSYGSLPKPDEAISLKIDRFATALPLNEFKRKDASSDFANRFKKGVHRIVINTFDIPVVVEITFDYVNVMPEGLPATLALVYDPQDPVVYRNDALFDHVHFDPKLYVDGRKPPRIFGKQLANMNILQVDIGDGSTDCVIVKKLTIQLPESDGIEEGIGSCAHKAIKFLNQDNPNNVGATRQKFLDIAYSKDDTDAKNAYLAPIYREALEAQLPAYFQRIDRQVKRMISGYKDGVDFVVVSGGGASVLKKYHLKDFEDKIKSASGYVSVPVLVVPDQEGQLLNLYGLMILLYRLRLANYHE